MVLFKDLLHYVALNITLTACNVCCDLRYIYTMRYFCHKNYKKKRNMTKDCVIYDVFRVNTTDNSHHCHVIIILLLFYCCCYSYNTLLSFLCIHTV